jgi:mRNA interferase RelE/StbE
LAWKIELDPKALGELTKLDRKDQRRILKFLKERVAPPEDPRSIGDHLRGPLKRFWKYRVGAFRIICDIQDDSIKILVVRIGHRKEVYRKRKTRKPYT